MSPVPALIPAAGRGTRLRPVTNYLSKPMLPLGSEPVIRYVIEEALDAGCSPVVVVRSPDDDELKRYVHKHFQDRVKLVVQSKPIGLADALRQGFETLDVTTRCATLLPDNVVLNGSGIKSLMEVDRSATVLGTVEVDRDQAKYFGNSGDYEASPTETEGSIERVVGLQEKSQGTFRERYNEWPVTRSVARNLLTPEFFERAKQRSPDPETGEIDDVPILRAMVKSSDVFAAPIDGDVYDMGTPERYTHLNCVIHRQLETRSDSVD